MEIKTCEQYVLRELLNAQDELESLRKENRSLRKSKSKYEKLIEALYNSLDCCDNHGGLSSIRFKKYSCLFNDDVSYEPIREAIDEWASTVEKSTESDDSK